MKTNIVIVISPPIPCLAKFWFLSYRRKCCWPIKLQDSSNCNISRKKWTVKFIFSMQINIEVFYKLMLSFWVCVARHSQSTQNKKFHIFGTFQKNVGMKLIFCMQINMKVFYKLIVSLWVWVTMPKVPKLTSLQYLCNISRKTRTMKLIFCLQMNVKSFFKLILSFQMCVVSHAQITQSNNFVIFLQYLKKEVIAGVDLHEEKHQRRVSYKLIIGVLMEVVKHSRSSQKSKSVMSSQYCKKEIRAENDFLHANKHPSFLQVDFNTLSVKVSYKVILS